MECVVKPFSACVKKCLQQIATEKKQDDPPEFGKDMREHQFLLQKNEIFLNHGSRGSIPKRVFDAQSRMLLEVETDPDFYVEVTYPWKRDVSRAALAKYFNAELDNITLVENATTGLGNALHSITLGPGEEILFNNHTYGAVQNAIKELVNTSTGTKAVQIYYKLPIKSTEEIIQQYKDILIEHPNVKVAVIDHISSSGILFPLVEIVSVCKYKGVLVLVDGAHCPGHIRLDLQSIGADFYIGNLHKWMYSPRGCAFQYVTSGQHKNMRPAIPSFEFEDIYPVDFNHSGLRDTTPLSCVSEVLEFVDWIGGEKAVGAYADKIWDEVLPKLTSAWGSNCMGLPNEMKPPLFRNVALPDIPGYPPSKASVQAIQALLRENYNIKAKLEYLEEKLYVRLSLNIYNTAADYIALRDAVLDIMKKKY